MREDISGGYYSALCPNCGESIWNGRIETRIISEDDSDILFIPQFPNKSVIMINPKKSVCKKCGKLNKEFNLVNKEFENIGKELINKGYRICTNINKKDAYIIIMSVYIGTFKELREQLHNINWSCENLQSGIVRIYFNAKNTKSNCTEYDIEKLYSVIKNLPSKRRKNNE